MRLSSLEKSLDIYEELSIDPKSVPTSRVRLAVKYARDALRSYNPYEYERPSKYLSPSYLASNRQCREDEKRETLLRIQLALRSGTRSDLVEALDRFWHIMHSGAVHSISGRDYVDYVEGTNPILERLSALEAEKGITFRGF